ncbi:Hsp90 family chaperone [Lithospermum erythrorhizon]|uniref:Hsp90 family chaperone n=1 Tax=Lithospermum erythrorhizon TaxID=34254 RepID=A0AAV3NWS3_LITER
MLRRFASTAAASQASDLPRVSSRGQLHSTLSRLMDLIVNSLYSNKEVFQRELNSNASDALDKLRFLAVTEPGLLKDGGDLHIRIQADKDHGTITITDSGIGMTRQDLVDCLGTIAQSGTAKFLKALKDAGADSNLIGQFGVGFYSAFLVSERVEVSTKSPKSDKQFVWELGRIDPAKLIPRGTRLTLYLKRDDKGFAHPERIEKLMKNYSQFASFPIYTWQEKGFTKEVEKKKKTKTVVEKYWDWELTNETQPIRLQNPKEVSTEEYNTGILSRLHPHILQLRVKWSSVLVFISDDFDGELFPRYLSFVKGVVDSNDLSLNVSREILQESQIVRIMRKRLVRKAFDMIRGISDSENKDDYDKFWENYGKYMKLSCIEDRENHKRIAPLLRFFFSQSEDYMISLDEYVANMKPDQKDIYYVAHDSVSSAKKLPFLEKFLEKDLEVLLLVDPIDEVAVQNLKEYQEKFFVDISKEDLDLGYKNEEKEKEVKQEFGRTCEWIKKRLGDKVPSVQISNRLSSSPCVLVSLKFGWSANMERLMKAQTMVIKTLNDACKGSPDNEEALRAIDLLYDAALVSSGFTPENPSQLGGKIYEMMSMALSGKWEASSANDYQHQYGQLHQQVPHQVPETVEAEVVEPVQAGFPKVGVFEEVGYGDEGGCGGGWE